jgi:hypothetical protein
MFGKAVTSRSVAHAAASIALAFSTFAGLAYAEDDGSAWRTLYEERGVLVSTQEEPGQDLPRLRGQAKLNAPVLHLLAILLDDQHSVEWAKGADETNVLRNLDDGRTQIIYARSRQPWPVKDRDLVMKRTVEVVEPGRAYRVHLVCLPGEKPTLENVVRVQRCETNFVLRALSADSTQIDYRVHADPGGHTPAWMVRMASKSIPLDTLNGLARQIERTRGKYAGAVAQWASAR